MKSSASISFACAALFVSMGSFITQAADDAKQSAEPTAKAKTEGAPQTGKLVPMNKAKTVFLDKPGNRVVLKTKVVLREGLLEMLCCQMGTKEHEAVLGVESKAYTIHGALLALGLTPGTPVQFTPAFQAPTGPKIDIYVNWTDDSGKARREKAQTWVRHAVRRYYVHKMAALPDDLTLPKKGDLTFDAKHGELLWYGHMTKEQRDTTLAMSKDAEFKKAINKFYEDSQPREMEADFVFAGSQFYKDEQTGEEFYSAEGGDLICVANFPTAMIDVAMQSSSTGNENLVFEPFTERIPPLDTEVTVELIPAKKDAKAPNASEKKADKSEKKADKK